MSIINGISEWLHYHFDNLQINNLKAKIEKFDFETDQESIMVYFRLGRKKLLDKMELFTFEKKYFDRVSNYDKLRLTKFSTFQNLMNAMFQQDVCPKANIIQYIQEEINNEQLF